MSDLNYWIHNWMIKQIQYWSFFLLLFPDKALKQPPFYFESHTFDVFLESLDIIEICIETYVKS
jgi:hypothetical protein